MLVESGNQLGEHVAMIVAECTMDKPWALLVWGVITIILYSFIAIAGMDRCCFFVQNPFLI